MRVGKAMNVQTDWKTWRLRRDRMDILNVFRDNFRTSEAAKDSESTTMIRLNELNVKAGIARQQQYAVKQRKLLTSIIRGPLVATH
jgi:hypothetical protein